MRRSDLVAFLPRCETVKLQTKLSLSYPWGASGLDLTDAVATAVTLMVGRECTKSGNRIRQASEWSSKIPFFFFFFPAPLQDDGR